MVNDHPVDKEFEPSPGSRGVLRWAHEMGATTLGEAFDLLDQFENSNDVPEVLGHDDSIDDVRDDLTLGIDLVGADADLDALL
jgi:hypothetical protein